MSKKIQIGTDIVCISRFAKSLTTGNFIQKIYHVKEIEYCEQKALKARIASYAARFAAKEAFAKALGTGLYVQGIVPSHIWVENEESGRPILYFSDSLTKVLNDKGFFSVDVSLSHHEEYAVATVILYSL
ncbi:holo-ACP synthase [Pigmentibacter sp. JX0631]|uniref:holo-ACP synthase n=1 Tax=Pigmentibacter sp. JX0631 TaxID=2976982 RepID=UPI002468FED0|nr:holo-ACP synthase [Pigmentibacter sp. JX0631]WGL59854.1 holo-ACP synthase [Pigmentibacter sp. JX0631]